MENMNIFKIDYYTRPNKQVLHLQLFPIKFDLKEARHDLPTKYSSSELTRDHSILKQNPHHRSEKLGSDTFNGILYCHSKRGGIKGHTNTHLFTSFFPLGLYFVKRNIHKNTSVASIIP